MLMTLRLEQETSFDSAGNIDLDLPIHEADTLVSEVYRGLHIMIDVVFTMELPAEFGRTLLAKICELSSQHKVRPPPPRLCSRGSVGWEPHAIASYSAQGKLAFDVYVREHLFDPPYTVPSPIMLCPALEFVQVHHSYVLPVIMQNKTNQIDA